MELLKPSMLTACVLVIFTSVVHVDAKPRGYYSQPYNLVEGQYSCQSMDHYPCVTVPYGRGKRVCIPMTNLCDGHCDCPMGDDERLCEMISPTVVTSTVTIEETSTVFETLSLRVNITFPDVELITACTCTESQTLFSTYTSGTSIAVGEEVCSTMTVDGPADDHYFYNYAPTMVSPFSKTVACGPTQLFP